MKRATTVTLLCMGAGAFFVANAYESNCLPNNTANTQRNTADWTDAGGAAKPAPPPDTSCRSSGYSHYYSSHSHSGYGFASSGASRGGFGGSGHHSGS